mgnify:CR=1 FL=1
MAEPGAENAPQVKVYVVNEDAEQYGIQVVETLHGVKVLEVEDVETADRADALVAVNREPGTSTNPARRSTESRTL